MPGIELNKIAAAILLASLITMMVGFVVNILYKPDLQPKHRGYSVKIHENSTNASSTISTKEVKINIAELMKSANADAGREVAKKCQACHSLDKNGPNKIGPHLWNVVGAQKGHVESYKYSNSLISVGGVWDDGSLFHFLQKPSKFIQGTKMSFIGLNNPQDIANVILFLKTFVHD